MAPSPQNWLGYYRPLTSLLEFCGFAIFWLKGKNITEADQNLKITYLLGGKGIQTWKSFIWDDNNFCIYLA